MEARTPNMSSLLVNFPRSSFSFTWYIAPCLFSGSKLSLSATVILIFSSGITASAYRFLEPQTAPPPPRPSALPVSLMTAAKRIRFLPPGPIVSTCALFFDCFLSSSRVSIASRSTVAPASMNSTPALVSIR